MATSIARAADDGLLSYDKDEEGCWFVPEANARLSKDGEWFPAKLSWSGYASGVCVAVSVWTACFSIVFLPRARHAVEVALVTGLVCAIALLYFMWQSNAAARKPLARGSCGSDRANLFTLFVAGRLRAPKTLI